MSGVSNTPSVAVNGSLPSFVTPVGGSDGSVVRFISTDTQGRPNVNINGTVTVSGTVAATQSGNWTSRIVGNIGGVMDFVGQNVAAPANALLIGGEFNTTPTTVSSGNASPLQMDNAGNLLVDIKASALTDPAECAIATTSAPSKILIIGGKSADGTPVYNPIPLAVGSGSVVVSGAVTIGSGSAVIGHVIVDSGTITTVSASRTVGNAGATLDAVVGAATAPTNGVAVLGVFNSTSPTLTTGQSAALQLSANGSQLVQGYQPAAQTFGSITGTGAQTSVAVSNFNVCTLTLRTFTGTAPSITWKLQASDDNTNWVDLQGINNNSGQVTVSWTQAAALSAGTAGPSVDYTVGSYTNVRINVTAISGASATAAFGLALQSMPYESAPGALCQGLAASGATAVGNPVLVGGVFNTTVPALTAAQSGQFQVDTTGSHYVNVEGRKATYTMCTGTFTPKASASAPTFSIQGSGTKTIRINRILITQTGTTGTATPFFTDLKLQKFSALTGGVTGSTPTGSKNDSGNAAQSAICLVYSTVPSTATVIGGITREELTQVVTASATTLGISRVEWVFGDHSQQSAVLRGTAEYFGVVIPTIAAAAPICVITVEWTEE